MTKRLAKNGQMLDVIARGAVFSESEFYLIINAEFLRVFLPPRKQLTIPLKDHLILMQEAGG